MPFVKLHNDNRVSTYNILRKCEPWATSKAYNAALATMVWWEWHRWVVKWTITECGDFDTARRFFLLLLTTPLRTRPSILTYHLYFTTTTSSARLRICTTYRENIRGNKHASIPTGFITKGTEFLNRRLFESTCFPLVFLSRSK